MYQIIGYTRNGMVLLTRNVAGKDFPELVMLSLREDWTRQGVIFWELVKAN
jgi:hypothetical protein